MPVPQGYGSHQGPSCLDKVKTGFLMGCCVGAASGIIFGGFTALRYGYRGRELIATLGKVMGQSGLTFGTFMAVASAIRC